MLAEKLIMCNLRCGQRRSCGSDKSRCSAILVVRPAPSSMLACITSMGPHSQDNVSSESFDDHVIGTLLSFTRFTFSNVLRLQVFLPVHLQYCIITVGEYAATRHIVRAKHRREVRAIVTPNQLPLVGAFAHQ